MLSVADLSLLGLGSSEEEARNGVLEAPIEIKRRVATRVRMERGPRAWENMSWLAKLSIVRSDPQYTNWLEHKGPQEMMNFAGRRPRKSAPKARSMTAPGGGANMGTATPEEPMVAATAEEFRAMLMDAMLPTITVGQRQAQRRRNFGAF